MSVALLLAVFADHEIRGRAIYRTLLIWPYAIAPAISAVLWLFILNPQVGLLGRWLNAHGVPWDYTINGGQALLMVIVASAWKQVSYNFIFFLAGLQSIPRAVTEAARMDGAKGWHRFRTITFPLLAPTTFFLLVVNLVYAAFDTFGTIYALTHGGPGKDTETLVIKVYRDGVVNLDLGSSSAQSVMLMVGRDRADRDPVPLHGPADRHMSTSTPSLTLPRFAGEGIRTKTDWLAHIVLGLGVLLFALPVWLVVAGSTQDSGAITRGELSLLPSFDLFGVSACPDARHHGHPAGVAHAAGLRRHGARDRRRQDRDFDPVRLRRGVLPLPVPPHRILADLHHADAAGRGSHHPDLCRDVGLRPDQQLHRSHRPADRLGHRDLLFRQVFVAIPDELVEAARMDGAGPLRFLRDILIPVSAANIAALFVILFVYGWNQYLWPLLVATDPGLDTIVIGIVKMIGVETQTDWSAVMATAVLALLPPVAVVVVMQRWFVAGLTEGEK